MCKRLKGIEVLVFLIFANSIECNINFAVEHCPGTEVPNIRYHTNFNEISLIFYYTQWSDQSLEALKHFNDVAAILGDKVYFAAIDCWHLECNCSNTLSTAIGSGSPHKWPTMIMYYGRLNQLKIQYNGLFTFRDILNFIMNIMQPFERIEKREDLEKMQSLTDGIVLGVFKNPNCIEYKHYLISALKWLEHDPIRTYRFIVTFTKEKEIFNKTDVIAPNLLLFGHKTNKTFADYIHFKWNTSIILRWLHEEFNDEYGLLHGYSTPITIAHKLKKNPVLAIFVNEPQHFFTYMEKYVDNQKWFSKSLSACQISEQKNAKINYWKEQLNTFTITQNLPTFGDDSKSHNYKDILKNLKFYYEINHYLELQKQVNFYNKPNLEVRELLRFFQYTNCLQKNFTLDTSLHISVVKRLEGYLENEKKCCKVSNRTMSVVILDTQRYKDFLQNLDITPTFQSMATVFIIDNERENMFVMKDRFAMFNLMEFVKKFYSNGLNNYLKNYKIVPSPSPIPHENDIELKELNRIMFSKYLQYTHNQTLVVLIYSPDCALCGNIQHSFMQLSLLLRQRVDLKFIRINVMENELPWQFNMPFLPALLVFPENRFSESRLFPTHLKPDVRNVFGFILSQLSAHQQVGLVLTMCQSGTLPKRHTQGCWQFAKTILMQHIRKHLHYWALFEAERNLIFDRLRDFLDLDLDIKRNLRL